MPRIFRGYKEILYIEYLEGNSEKQWVTRHRPMAHPVVFRYLSYSTRLAEHALHRLVVLGLPPVWDMFVLSCSVK